MPTTLTGLIIFVIILTPGFCYVICRERLTARRTLSVFRETVSVIVASVISLAIVVGIFALIRTSFPTQTPDIGKLVRTPKAYFQAHYAYLSLWIIILLVAACIIAAISAREPTWAASVNWEDKRPRWLFGHIGTADRIDYISAWWTIFQENTDKFSRVTCKLDDGSIVQGWLNSYNPDVAEIADRDIILAAPLLIRQPSGDVIKEDRGGMVISARKMIYMHVAYIDVVGKQTSPHSNLTEYIMQEPAHFLKLKHLATHCFSNRKDRANDGAEH